MYVFHNLFSEMALKKKTRADMADYLHITHSTFSKKLRGYSEFTLSEIKAIIELFKKPFEYLFKVEN